MKISFIFFFLITLSSVFVTGANYDFGTMQKGASLIGEPGGETNASLYFFLDAFYGDRITHILVTPEEVPEGWEIELNPPAHEQILNVSGIRTVSIENLYVEPRPILPKIPEPPEEGVNYLASPSGLGYLQAKEIKVNIKVPQNAELGKTYTLSVIAQAFWFGTSGTVALKQTRKFSYKVTVLQKDYTESIITSLVGGNETMQAEQESQMPDLQTLLITGLVIALILLAIYTFFIKDRR